MKWRGITEKSAGPSTASLRDQLLEIRANIAQYVPAEKQAINERAIDQLRANGPKPLPAGAIAPNFNLPDQHGKLISSADLLAKGKLIVIFFRGRWCPFCVTTLEAWQSHLPQIENAGASLVAISPMLPRHSSFIADQHKLRFPVLSDSGNQVAERFGVAYTVNDEQRALMKSVFINLPQQNGDETWQLPVPAAFVISQDGTILHTAAEPDYRTRAEPSEIIGLL
jgi:peroxiredoxin